MSRTQGPPGPPSVRQRARRTAFWFVTALDDVFVEKFWTRLRQRQTGLAFRDLGETLIGWWRLFAVVAVAMMFLWILLD